MKKRKSNKNIFLSKKRGVSPVIATVLLVGMVMVTGLIIFVWFKGMTQAAITKDLGTGGKNIELVCDDVKLDASYSSETLFISNNAGTPIFGIELKIFEDRSYKTINLKDISNSNWPETGLKQADTFSGNIGDEIGSSTTEIILVPILIGSSKDGEKIHTCDADKHGYEIIIG